MFWKLAPEGSESLNLSSVSVCVCECVKDESQRESLFDKSGFESRDFLIVTFQIGCNAVQSFHLGFNI